MALMRLNDEIVMTPEMNFSKREKEIYEMDGGREDISRDSDDFVNLPRIRLIPSEKHAEKINAPNKTQVACYAAATKLI